LSLLDQQIEELLIVRQKLPGKSAAFIYPYYKGVTKWGGSIRDHVKLAWVEG